MSVCVPLHTPSAQPAQKRQLSVLGSIRSSIRSSPCSGPIQTTTTAKAKQSQKSTLPRFPPTPRLSHPTLPLPLPITSPLCLEIRDWSFQVGKRPRLKNPFIEVAGVWIQVFLTIRLHDREPPPLGQETKVEKALSTPKRTAQPSAVLFGSKLAQPVAVQRRLC